MFLEFFQGQVHSSSGCTEPFGNTLKKHSSKVVGSAADHKMIEISSVFDAGYDGSMKYLDFYSSSISNALCDRKKGVLCSNNERNVKRRKFKETPKVLQRQLIGDIDKRYKTKIYLTKSETRNVLNKNQ